MKRVAGGDPGIAGIDLSRLVNYPGGVFLHGFQIPNNPLGGSTAALL